MNPLYNDNRLKLGIFCTNARGASSTLVPEAHTASWDFSLRTARTADKAGYEAVVPFVRWKGYQQGRPEHYSGEVYEPFTWAAGISQATQHVAVLATSHAPTIHPIVAAKMAATVDHISNGRFAINVVAGWNKPELDMFGAPMREHEERYAQLAEWLTVMRRLWSEKEEFDFAGDFYKIEGGMSMPKPIQASPPIMNAGHSDAGARFAAEHADICLIVTQSEDPAAITAQVEKYKKTARETYGREVQVWTNTYIVQRDTQSAADDYVQRYAVEYEDSESVDAMLKLQGIHSEGMPAEALAGLRMRMAAGAGGFPLVGPPDVIAARLEMLSDCGVDGVLLTWVDYDAGMAAFSEEVLPRLEAAGLRKPFNPVQA